MTQDQERWAEALAVERMHGDKASSHAAVRIAELAAAGDAAGASRWREISDRLNQLRLRPQVS